MQHIDSACAVDLFSERTIAARAPAEFGSAERTAVDLDAETRAALTVWGDIPK